VVSKEKVTGFTIETCVGLWMLLVLGLLGSEGESNTVALIRYGGFASWIMASRLLTKFDSKADGTLIEHMVLVFEFGDTIDVMVSVVHIFKSLDGKGGGAREGI
jgi:hypothetical protein